MLGPLVLAMMESCTIVLNSEKNGSTVHEIHLKMFVGKLCEKCRCNQSLPKLWDDQGYATPCSDIFFFLVAERTCSCIDKLRTSRQEEKKNHTHSRSKYYYTENSEDKIQKIGTRLCSLCVCVCVAHSKADIDQFLVFCLEEFQMWVLLWCTGEHLFFASDSISSSFFFICRKLFKRRPKRRLSEPSCLLFKKSLMDAERKGRLLGVERFRRRDERKNERKKLKRTKEIWVGLFSLFYHQQRF